MIKLFLIFGIAGCFGELVFTALKSRAKGLQGHSNLWVFPLYGLGALLFPMLFDAGVGELPFWLRGSIYAAIILAVEYVVGVGLEYWHGECPWDYKEHDAHPWYISSHARLDYFPIWFIVGFIGEMLYMGVGA